MHPSQQPSTRSSYNPSEHASTIAGVSEDQISSKSDHQSLLRALLASTLGSALFLIFILVGLATDAVKFCREVANNCRESAEALQEIVHYPE